MKDQLTFDRAKCVGCGACSVSCMDQLDWNPLNTPPLRKISTVEEVVGGTPCVHYHSTACTHCADAPCIASCPHGCYVRDRETGLVLLDNKKCVGCGLCAKSCPIDAVSFDRSGVAQKCNGCYERVLLGLPPACVRACQNGAITCHCPQLQQEPAEAAAKQ